MTALEVYQKLIGDDRDFVAQRAVVIAGRRENQSNDIGLDYVRYKNPLLVSGRSEQNAVRGEYGVTAID